VRVEVDADDAFGVREPTTLPASSMSIGVCHASPPKSPMLMTLSPLPQHRVTRGELADRDIAVAGNTDGLASVVDPGRGGRRIAGQRPGSRFVPFLVSHMTARNCSTCGAIARRIVHRRLGPTDDLAWLLTLVAKP
jgi:hypothetical protein